MSGYVAFFGSSSAPSLSRILSQKIPLIRSRSLSNLWGPALSTETVYGVTSHPPATASAAAILAFNRDHWTVENACHYILDWNWDEDRCTIRTGHGPENITALRRFAIGAIKAKSRDTVAATIQRLARNVRLVFDYLRMTDNSRYRPPTLQALAG
jgi:hypothetical protein